jgi:hypothetical protein
MSRTGFYFSFTPGLLSIDFSSFLVNIPSLGYSVVLRTLSIRSTASSLVELYTLLTALSVCKYEGTSTGRWPE